MTTSSTGKPRTPAQKAAATRAANKAKQAAAPADLHVSGDGLKVTEPGKIVFSTLTPAPDATGPGAPGPKPTTLVVGETLNCQGLDGEVSLSLVVPYKKIKLVMNQPDDIEEAEMIDWLLEEVMDPEDAQKLLGLRDGAQTIGFAGAWMQAVGERLGASLGKSGPSSS